MLWVDFAPVEVDKRTDMPGKGSHMDIGKAEQDLWKELEHGRAGTWNLSSWAARPQCP